MPKEKRPDRLIFTDLDGTLLDHDTYSWKPAEPALKLAEKMGIPVIFCTSKTRAEIEACKKDTGNRHPFIAENGDVIFIPEGYFRRKPARAKRKGKYLVIVLGKPYSEVRGIIKAMQKKGFRVRGFGDMTVQEIIKLTGLPEERARLARKREYDEPFILEDPEQESGMLDYIAKQGLQCIRGGRFYHLMGGNGKGFAAKTLAGMYSLEAGKPVVTAGLGDSPNDFPLLRAVDVPYLLVGRKKSPKSPGLFIEIDAPSRPEGWNTAVMKFLEEF